MSSEDHAASQPFLYQSPSETSDSLHEESKYDLHLSRTRFKSPGGWKWTYIHLVAILLYTIAFLIATFFLTRKSENSTPNLIHLPARSALQWEVRRLEISIKQDNPFVGEPRPELEEAWHTLLQHDNIQVPLEYFEPDVDVIKLRDGSGAIAQLSVFHALHCLKKIRQWTYKDHYYESASENRLWLESRHSDHCIEYIRNYLMCKPDVSLVTFKWVNGTQGNGTIGTDTRMLPSSKDMSRHECVNWEKLDDWAEKRKFNLFRSDLLEYPE